MFHQKSLSQTIFFNQMYNIFFQFLLFFNTFFYYETIITKLFVEINFSIILNVKVTFHKDNFGYWTIAHIINLLAYT